MPPWGPPVQVARTSATGPPAQGRTSGTTRAAGHLDGTLQLSMASRRAPEGLRPLTPGHLAYPHAALDAVDVDSHRAPEGLSKLTRRMRHSTLPVWTRRRDARNPGEARLRGAEYLIWARVARREALLRETERLGQPR
jgi:hypothetical protein